MLIAREPSAKLASAIAIPKRCASATEISPLTIGLIDLLFFA